MGDVTVSVKDLLYRILRHWRSFIVCMLIGGMIFDVFGIIKSKNEVQKFESLQEMAEDNGSNKVQIAEFKEKLSDIEVTQVERVTSIYKTYQKSYEDTVNYINNSIKMQLDPNCICTNVLQYHIDVDYTVTYPVIEDKDPTQNIKDSIYYKLVNDATCTQIASSLGESIDSSYIKELISAPTASYSSAYKDDLYTITVMGRSYDECNKITTVLQEKIVDVFKELKTQYGDFTYTAMPVQKYKSFNQSVLDAQKSQANSLREIRTNSTGLIDALSADQKTYFYALINGDDTVEISLPVEKGGSTDTTIAVAPEVKYFNPKLVVVGAVGGFLLAFLFLLCRVLMGGKLISEDTIRNAYAYEPLGSIRVSEEPSGPFSGIDKRILRAMDSGAADFTPEERLRMVLAGIRIAAKKNDWKKIFITGIARDKESGEVRERLRNQLEGELEEVNIGETIVYDPESLQEMASSDAVVLVERLDSSGLEEIDRECILCRHNQVPVIGYVILK